MGAGVIGGKKYPPSSESEGALASAPAALDQPPHMLKARRNSLTSMQEGLAIHTANDLGHQSKEQDTSDLMVESSLMKGMMRRKSTPSIHNLAHPMKDAVRHIPDASGEPESPKSPKSPKSPSARKSGRVLLVCQQCGGAANTKKYIKSQDLALCERCIKKSQTEHVPMECRPQGPQSPKTGGKLDPLARAIVRNSIRQYE